jgi:hypothetical protein|tara:strand:+ start:387 stop:509 length:123 start_codon:yes stop_codon:yes gene_type:complete
MTKIKTEYLWMLKPISKKNKKIRNKAKIKDARRAGVYNAN